jgi:aryl-alcohol dehydrogenase-like predicted oxidoreductase
MECTNVDFKTDRTPVEEVLRSIDDAVRSGKVRLSE